MQFSDDESVNDKSREGQPNTLPENDSQDRNKKQNENAEGNLM